MGSIYHARSRSHYPRKAATGDGLLTILFAGHHLALRGLDSTPAHKTSRSLPDAENIREFVAHLVMVGHISYVEYLMVLCYMNRVATALERAASTNKVRAFIHCFNA